MPWRAALIIKFGKLYVPAAALIGLALYQLIIERDGDGMWKSLSEALVILGFAGVGQELLKGQEITRRIIAHEPPEEPDDS